MCWDCKSPYKSEIYNPNISERNGFGNAEMKLNWEEIIIQNSDIDLEEEKTV